MEKFYITVASLPDREQLVSEICYDHLQWVEISQETGALIIEFYFYQKKPYWEFPYDEALKMLKRARNRLLFLPDAESSDELYRSLAEAANSPTERAYREDNMNRFEILIASPPQKEQVIAEIYYNNMCWAQIFQKENLLTVRFCTPPTEEYWRFSFDAAWEILEQANNALLGVLDGGSAGR